jgi:CBS domain containing-hemolysin-like protein
MPVYSEAELRQLIDISRESGHLRAEERRLIHRVFEFSDTLVREAMVPRPEVAALSAQCTLEDINQAFQKHRYSRLPVYRESMDNVIRLYPQQGSDSLSFEAAGFQSSNRYSNRPCTL